MDGWKVVNVTVRYGLIILMLLIGLLAGFIIGWFCHGWYGQPVLVTKTVTAVAPPDMAISLASAKKEEHMLSYREARFSPRGKTETRNRSGFLTTVIRWFDLDCAANKSPGWAKPYGYGSVDIGGDGQLTKWFCFAEHYGDFVIFFSRGLSQAELAIFRNAGYDAGNGINPRGDVSESASWGYVDGFYTEYDIPEKFLTIVGRDVVEYDGETREVIKVSEVDARGVMDDVVRKLFDKTGLKFQVAEYLE